MSVEAASMNKPETEIILDCDRLQSLLPHRFPLLMLDRVQLLAAERRARGLKNLTINEPYFQGHFPGYPILPGMLIVEAFVQTGGAAIREFLNIQSEVALLLTLDNVKFRKPVLPGDRLLTDVVLQRFHNGVAKFAATAKVGDAPVGEAQFTIGLNANVPERVRVTEFAPPLISAQVPLPPTPIETINGVMNIIPHRYPFILVDAVYFKDDKRVIGLKNVTGNESFFNGHFPRYPIMPGTLLVEAIAQVGAVFVLGKPQNKGKLAYLTTVERARFRRPVRPGDQLLIDVRETAVRPRVGKAAGAVFVGEHLVAEARISFALADSPPPS